MGEEVVALNTGWRKYSSSSSPRIGSPSSFQISLSQPDLFATFSTFTLSWDSAGFASIRTSLCGLIPRSPPPSPLQHPLPSLSCPRGLVVHGPDVSTTRHPDRGPGPKRYTCGQTLDPVSSVHCFDVTTAAYQTRSPAGVGNGPYPCVTAWGHMIRDPWPPKPVRSRPRTENRRKLRTRVVSGLREAADA